MRCKYPKAIAGKIAYIFTVWLWRNNALFEFDNFRGKVFYFRYKRRLQATDKQQVRQKLMVGTLLIGLWNKENGSFSILASFQIECKMIPLTSPLNKWNKPLEMIAILNIHNDKSKLRIGHMYISIQKIPMNKYYYRLLWYTCNLFSSYSYHSYKKNVLLDWKKRNQYSSCCARYS